MVEELSYGLVQAGFFLESKELSALGKDTLIGWFRQEYLLFMGDSFCYSVHHEESNQIIVDSIVRRGGVPTNRYHFQCAILVFVRSHVYIINPILSFCLLGGGQTS